MKRIEFTEKEVKDIIDLYLNFNSQKEIGKKYNVDQGVIRRVLTENNITIRKRTPPKKIHREVSEEIKDKIVYNYTILEMSASKAGLEFNISQGKTQNILQERGVTLRTYVESKDLLRKYSVNDNFFKEQNPNMAYLLGLIAADGNVATKENCISIELQREDCELLEEIKKVTESTRDISYYSNSRNKKLAKFQVWSSFWKKDLAIYGIVPNKTFILKPPTFLNSKYYIDYIRGYFDGDGTICQHDGYSVSFEIGGASKEVIEWIRNVLATNYGISNNKIYSSITPNGKNFFYKTSYLNRKTVERIYKILYTPNSLYMKRKKDKFETLLKIPRDSNSSE